MGKAVLHIGDARKILVTYSDHHFDAAITDPPHQIDVTKNESGRGGRNWDRSAIASDPTFWALLLAKMHFGANLAVMLHPRTGHRTTTAIEDAGFQIIDQLAWINGQGFAPGALDLGGGRTTHLRPALTSILLARAPVAPGATLALTIGTTGVGGFHIDALRTPVTENRSRTPGRVNELAAFRVTGREAGFKSAPNSLGRKPSNVILQHEAACACDCADDCAVEAVRRQGLATRGRGEDASRLYTVLHHPKAGAQEVPVVDGLRHASPKPLGVMEWLVSLTTQPGNLILDPFSGSGSTLEAAVKLGRRVVAMELDSGNAPVVAARMSRQGLKLDLRGSTEPVQDKSLRSH